MAVVMLTRLDVPVSYENSISNSPSASLPERWKRGRQIAALSSLAAVLVLSGLLHRQGNADGLDGWWLRARFSGREWLQNRQSAPKPDARIAIVEIDDKSIRDWKNQSQNGKISPFSDQLIFWGQHITDGLNQLHRSGARLVALDWTQAVETDEFFRWNHDQKLGEALQRVKNVVFVKFIGNDGAYVLPTESLRYALPDAIEDGGQKYLGFADFVASTGLQTSLIPEIKPEKQGENLEVSFAKRIAQNSGWPVPKVPLREDETLLINFANNTAERGAGSPFLRASLSDVARATSPDPRWKDKIVFIGGTYKGANDSHSVPFSKGLTGSRLASGVEVQAHAVATLLSGNALGEPKSPVIWLLSALLGAMGVVSFALWSNWARAAWLVGGMALSWMALSFGLFVGANYALPLALPLASLLLGSGLMGGYRALTEERERAKAMKVWGRHQNPRVIAELLANPDWRAGQGREMTVTVLFADLKSFTQTVEALSPAQALEALNRYLALFSKAIERHDGIVDKYLGDGLMALWGAPAARDDHATAAVNACLDIQRRIAAMTPQLKRDGEVTFEARLTLHTGPAVVGLVGSDENVEYTIIGDTVNVTSRLQETAKALGCDFLISETTCEALKGSVRIGQETEVKIRGRQAPLRVFEVMDDAIHEENGAPTAKTSQ